MDVARLNFSHGSHSEHLACIQSLRATANKLGKTIAILADLQGPKIRTGPLAGGRPVARLGASPGLADPPATRKTPAGR